MSAPARPAGPAPRPAFVPLPWHDEARTLLAVGDPPLVLLVGEPGTGKTTFAQQAARAATGRPALVLSGSPETEQTHLFGRWALAGDRTEFADGPLPLALKAGRRLVVEEFSLIPVECRAALLPLRDQAEVTNPLTGEVVPVPPEFRLVATSNSESLTCRKNAGISKVLYDGLLVAEVPALPDAHVLGLLKAKFPRASKKALRRTLELWNEYRGLTGGASTGAAHPPSVVDGGKWLPTQPAPAATRRKNASASERSRFASHDAERSSARRRCSW